MNVYEVLFIRAKGRNNVYINWCVGENMKSSYSVEYYSATKNAWYILNEFWKYQDKYEKLSTTRS